jgi:dTDP-4-amino-4,6-dideoxygalactose transaminase
MSLSQASNSDTKPVIDATQPVPLFDNRRQFRELEAELLAAVTSVSQSGQYIMGPECQKLEQRLAEFCRAPHALGCASGSDALLLALMALDIGPGDEVILPSYTFFATASCVSRLGAKPVFVDIDPESFNLDPRAIEPAITSNTKAIIPVHLYGQCADMQLIANIARPRSLPVIEDACQAIGAELYGRRAGELGDMACFSFYPTKNLGCFGDGGLITTIDDKLADRLKLLRAHGMQPRYYHQVIGINSRLDSIQAAVLNVKLGYLDAWTMARAERAHQYVELCQDVGLHRILSLPIVQPGRRHVWNQYVIRVPDGRRDELRAYLAERKIGTEIYYPVPLHRQQCYADLGYAEGSLPETERAARETLALPIFPELTMAEQQRVVDELAGFFGCRRTTNIAKPHFINAASRGEARHAP